MTTPPIPVILAPGTLPPPWDRPGIFVANLLSLFFGNEAQTLALRDTVGRLESYGARLLPAMGLLYHGASPNTVVLEQTPQPELLRYFAGELGLATPHIQVLPHQDLLAATRAGDPGAPPPPAALERLIAHLRQTPDAWIDGFVTDDTLVALARLSGHVPLNHPHGSFVGNHKRLLHDHLTAAGLPVFTTHLVENRAALPGALRQLAAAGYTRAALKAPIGASGIGLWHFATNDPAPAPPAYAFAHGACLLQGWIDAASRADIAHTHSPSAQLLVRPEAVYLYDLTEQILSEESIHQGNTSSPPGLAATPARDELLRQATSVARWLHGQGYLGTASIDFHVAEHTDGRLTVRVCEVNARVTGATYPALLARHFAPRGAWLMRNVRFAPAPPPAAILAALRAVGVLYQPGRDLGLLPINFNPNSAGAVAKGQFLCLAPDLAAAARLLDILARCLPGADSFDRD